MSTHQRGIERITAALGRPRSIYVVLSTVALWTSFNACAALLGARPLDPPPYGTLQGLVGLAALLMTIMVLTTQNRQSRHAEQRAHLDLQVNLLARARRSGGERGIANESRARQLQLWRVMDRHWWNERDAGVWDRVKEALRRDWEQTKFDMNLGGHELNQTSADTLGQASGEAPMPPIDRANPPRIIADWGSARMPIEYGYVARRFFGDEYPEWTPALERRLERDWCGTMSWKVAAVLVRHGYELKD